MVLSTAFLVSTKKVPYLRIIPGSRFCKGAKWIPYLIYLRTSKTIAYFTAHTYIAYIWEYTWGGAIQRDILPVPLPPAIMNTPMIFFEWQHSIRSKYVS